MQTGLRMNKALHMRNYHALVVLEGLKTQQIDLCCMHISVAKCISDLCENSFSFSEGACPGKIKCSE